MGEFTSIYLRKDIFMALKKYQHKHELQTPYEAVELLIKNDRKKHRTHRDRIQSSNLQK